MKKTLALAALATTAALALAGCAGDESPIDSENTQTLIADPSATSPESAPDDSPSPELNVEQAKADAIANGRPEAAWDIDCVAWELPDADTPEQEWANDLGADWLADKGVECPDQLPSPMYFVESFTAGEEGELLVVAEDLRGVEHLAAGIAGNVFEAVSGGHPDLVKATTVIPDGTVFGYATADGSEVVQDWLEDQ